jgi:XapX domain-containing protein
MPYLISLAAGFVVGLLYCLVRVQSPAPPLIALAGLLGIVLGEHTIPVVRAHLFPDSVQVQQVETSVGAPASAKPSPSVDPGNGGK